MANEEKTERNAIKVHVLDPSTFEYQVGDTICKVHGQIKPPDDWESQPEGMVWHGIFQKWMTFEDANKEYWVDPKEIGLTEEDLDMDEEDDTEGDADEETRMKRKFVMEFEGKRLSLSDEPDEEGGIVFVDDDGNRDTGVSDDAMAYMCNWRIAHSGEYDPSGLIDILIAYAHAIGARIIEAEDEDPNDERVY